MCVVCVCVFLVAPVAERTATSYIINYLEGTTMYLDGWPSGFVGTGMQIVNSSSKLDAIVYAQ